MDTKALEKFCPWARVELIDAVHLRCVRYALDDAGRAAHPADADVVAGTVLTPSEKEQRAALFERIEHLNEERDGKGYAAFCEQQAYSWFNRFAAIRYMELHGYLSNNVRMLSATSGAFEPECLRMASELDLPGLELAEVLDLITAGNDEALFRRILVAQMNELADCLPTVFGHVDDADALTLPDNLLAHGEHDVLFHLVADIPEEAWGDVEVLGWMYQFYNSELKDAFFKSKRKAAVEDLAPATQLFTPDWIVRYMVENSLGRLWMLNNPGSRLREDMAYYIEPDAQHEDFIRIEGPEDITFCDPACGSGHILVYTFSLLFEMYAERGYRERDIPQLILGKNLSGMEIDERAAQIASLVLAMCAREHDRRFFTRGVTADICVLGDVDIDVDALDPASALRQRPKLIEALAHLSEVGSLLNPTSDDLGALKGELMRGLSGDLFVSHTQAGIERAAAYCEALSRTFDVVVANPPYMGSSSFNPFMSKWMKANYPDFKSDLFAAFISRIGSLCAAHGEAGIMSPFVWMFISSYEKLRNMMIDEKTLTSLVQLEYSGFSGATVPICTFTFHNSHVDGYMGGYVRLSDFVGAAVQGPKTLEAIQNPGCGWFYHADASTFHDIPGSPIAYWASDAVRRVFEYSEPLGNDTPTHLGMATCNNERFLRYWWEPSNELVGTPDDFSKGSSQRRWAPYNKGGIYRKWSGNDEYVVDWKDSGRYINSCGAVMVKESLRFQEMASWTRVSSGMLAVRYKKPGYLFDMTGPGAFGNHSDLIWRTAFLNSSTSMYVARFMSASLDFQPGQIAQYPIIEEDSSIKLVMPLAYDCIDLSQLDWNDREAAWDFKRSPLIPNSDAEVAPHPKAGLSCHLMPVSAKITENPEDKSYTVTIDVKTSHGSRDHRRDDEILDGIPQLYIKTKTDPISGEADTLSGAWTYSPYNEEYCHKNEAYRCNLVIPSSKLNGIGIISWLCRQTIMIKGAASSSAPSYYSIAYSEDERSFFFKGITS